MTEVVYCVAMSLDGYIVMPDGDVEWLAPYEAGDEDSGHSEFYASIGSVLMGSRTYGQSLSIGDWPDGETPCWVFSRRSLNAAHAESTITDKMPKDVLADLDERSLRAHGL